MRANIDIIVFKRLTFFVHFFFFFFGGLRSLHRHRIEEEEDNQLMSAELLLILNLLFFLWSVSILNSDFGVRASPLPAPMPRYIYWHCPVPKRRFFFVLFRTHCTMHNCIHVITGWIWPSAKCRPHSFVFSKKRLMNSLTRTRVGHTCHYSRRRRFLR